jgi:hypothetical protein
VLYKVYVDVTLKCVVQGVLYICVKCVVQGVRRCYC